MLEILITIVLFALVAVLTVSFYISGGRYNAWINYGAPLLGFAALLSRKLVSPQVFMLWFLAVFWLFYLIATNVFTRCRTVDDFLSAYRPRYVRFMTSVLVIYALVNIIKSFGAETVVFLAITIAVWLAYASLLSRPRGDTSVYKISLSVQACLWIALVGVLGNGRLYDIQNSESGLTISWWLITEGNLNLPAIESISAEIVHRYFSILALSYLFFICGILYHELLHERARSMALKSYAIVLILMLYHYVPELRNGLGAIPKIGQYVSSPAILLGGVVVTMVSVVVPRKGDRSPP